MEKDNKEPLAVDPNSVETRKVLTCRVENVKGKVETVEIKADCEVMVLPCAVEKTRFVADRLETITVEGKLRLLVRFNVLPTIVENPMNPAERLETCTVDAVHVLPCAVENIIPLINKVEPVILEVTSVLPRRVEKVTTPPFMVEIVNTGIISVLP